MVNTMCCHYGIFIAILALYKMVDLTYLLITEKPQGHAVDSLAVQYLVLMSELDEQYI